VSAALVRSPEFRTGQWWRIFTPILVNPEGWHQIIFNAAMLLVVGTAAERVFGRLDWAVLYLAGGLTGNAFSYMTSNFSAGSSVAIAGLFGALVAWVAFGYAALPAAARFGAAAVIVAAAVLVMVRDNHGPPLLAGVGLGGIALWRHARQDAPTPTAREIA
jgi:rhomboid protease GluP